MGLFPWNFRPGTHFYIPTKFLDPSLPLYNCFCIFKFNWYNNIKWFHIFYVVFNFWFFNHFEDCILLILICIFFQMYFFLNWQCWWYSWCCPDVSTGSCQNSTPVVPCVCSRFSIPSTTLHLFISNADCCDSVCGVRELHGVRKRMCQSQLNRSTAHPTKGQYWPHRLSEVCVLILIFIFNWGKYTGTSL